MKATRTLSITFHELERAALDREKSIITAELVSDGHGTGIDHPVCDNRLQRLSMMLSVGFEDYCNFCWQISGIWGLMFCPIQWGSRVFIYSLVTCLFVGRLSQQPQESGVLRDIHNGRKIVVPLLIKLEPAYT
jgi:hypothetical protein